MMASPAGTEASQPNGHTHTNGHPSLQLIRSPMRTANLLSDYPYIEVTPTIGREYPTLQLSTLMTSPNHSALLRDLAIAVSERGVLFFRSQTSLTVPMQKDLVNALGTLTGRPPANGLHIHPLIHGKTDVGVDPSNKTDEHISVISSQLSQKLEGANKYGDRYRFASRGWHSDMTFEAMPSDYAVLKMRETPPSGGGDTLWASAYEVYDRLSTPFQRFLEGLSAVQNNPPFIAQSKRLGFSIHPGPRGAPENVGTHLTAVHPVVRTNPVTGWKSVYASHGNVERINELTQQESDEVVGYLNRLTWENHDLQCRFRWEVDSVAIWDNRCTFHTATADLEQGMGPRTGNRSVSCGERPYLDPGSTGRRGGCR